MQIRTIRLALWGLVVVAGMAALWLTVIGPRLENNPNAEIGRGDYQLVTTDGGAFDQATLRGKPSAIFFGFTHCPDVCPTTLGEIAMWQEGLGAEADDMNFYFVTVDPERDTADVLGQYVSWVPGVQGVTGSVEETAKATRAFRVYARKVPQEGDEYSMDHSAATLLFDGRGRFFGVIGYQEDPARALDTLRRLLNS